MLFAGFNVSNGDQTLLGIVAGRARRQHGRLLADLRDRLLRPHRPAGEKPPDPPQPHAPGLGRRAGSSATATPTVFFARLLPLVRAFISLPAGVAKMPFWRFTWLTALGSLPWVLGFALIGRAVGDNWEQWRHHLQVLDYLVVAGDRRR